MQLFCRESANIEQNERTIKDKGDDHYGVANLIFLSIQQLLCLLTTNLEIKFHQISRFSTCMWHNLIRTGLKENSYFDFPNC
jgi:isoprenylcysteine carboxyl methyltransferase (ICMT) family protein YpbQ